MKRYRIIHIEDHADLRDVIQMSLIGLDIELSSISSAEAGMNYLGSNAEIDLIICDFGFAGEDMDGLDIARCAELFRPNTPFILVSGGPGRPEKRARFEELLEIPGLVFLEKGSFSPDQLETTIRHFLPNIGQAA